MQLSVIIVNYNSKKWLEQCLYSLKKAIENIEAEILIIDNNSSDGSQDFISKNFPEVTLTPNEKNKGFSAACNQGIHICKGDLVLFLNPDTELTPNSIRDCINFFESHQNAGAAGVRMIDEKGNFLKESKRGFPSPASSFYKLFGFAGIFPQSPLFARYYLGHLPEEKNSPVEVLSGAFLMVRHNVIKKINGFDENFFMYGEDIDLSYRISKAGYDLYYLGEITITHIKGGSTIYDRKYIENFYGAMHYFVKKHYQGNKPGWMISLLHAGISARKMIATAGLLFR